MLKLLLPLLLCACTAKVPLTSKSPPILSAIAINASACHLAPLFVVIYADGSHKWFEAKDLPKGSDVLNSVHALPKSHVGTVFIPCDETEKQSEAPDDAPTGQQQHYGVTQLGFHPVADVPRAPMSAEHRKLRDKQGHLPPVTDAMNLCGDRIPIKVTWPSGNFTVTCSPATLQVAR